MSRGLTFNAVSHVCHAQIVNYTSHIHIRIFSVSTGWTVEESGFDFWQRQEIFLFSQTSRPGFGAHVTVGARGSFWGKEAVA
jgi:hypothetical protein